MINMTGKCTSTTPIQLRSIMQGAGTAAPRLARGCPAYHRRYIHTRGHNRDRDAQGPSLRAVTARAPRFDVDAPPRHTCQVHRCSREAARRAGGAWVQWVCGEMWDEFERHLYLRVRGVFPRVRNRPTSYHIPIALKLHLPDAQLRASSGELGK